MDPRFRDYMRVQTDGLLLAARQARLLDHSGNRGAEVEHQVREWFRTRLEPAFTVSSGEIVDSFGTLVAENLRARQQDAIVHENTSDARRFPLPSGLLLSPVETVAAVVEIKLTLTKGEFDDADANATEVQRLRLRLDRFTEEPIVGRPMRRRLIEKCPNDGLVLGEQTLAPTFAVFGLLGTSRADTIAEWLKGAKAISLACCLEAGCVWRVKGPGDEPELDPGYSFVVGSGDALHMFMTELARATRQHTYNRRWLEPDWRGYEDFTKLTYWDPTRFRHPGGDRLSEPELAALEAMGYSRADFEAT